MDKEIKYIPHWIVYICIVLITSIIGNIWQSLKIDELVEMDKKDVESFELLSNQYQELESRYEILSDEYTLLYESTK